MSDSSQQYRTHHHHQPTEPQTPATEDGGGPSELARRASAYRSVAEQARNDCVSDADALHELEQRRNVSGQ